jgi:DNA-binding LacI/PurR family transcriptional regulator
MPTIKDVALKSGYSTATISAVINNVPIVSPKAKKKILEAIEEVGYVPNAIARSLKSAKTLSLAILVHDITNPFYPEVISGLEEVAWANDYEVFLCNIENSLERESKYIDKLIEKCVDGVIISTSRKQRNPNYDKLRKHNIPYVFLNRRPDEMYEDEYFVGANNLLAAELVVEFIKEQELSKVAFISGPQQYFTFKERLEGFVRGMEKASLTLYDKWVLTSENYNEEAGYNHAKELIRSGDLPEVIFCSSDLLAFGVYTALKEECKRIPDEISLIGFDNDRFGHLIDLCSVDLQNRELGRVAGQRLIELSNTKELDANKKESLLEPRLVIRNSCRLLRDK